MLEFQRLQCNGCGSPRFLRVTYLKYKRGGGVVEEPAGYVCQECQGLVDSSLMIRHHEVKEKVRELAALKAEISDLSPDEAMEANE